MEFALKVIITLTFIQISLKKLVIISMDLNYDLVNRIGYKLVNWKIWFIDFVTNGGILQQNLTAI